MRSVVFCGILLLGFVIQVESILVFEDDEDQCVCEDIPPNDLYTCEQQKEWGKCDRSWMISGDYCASSCGRCSCTDPEPAQPESCTCEEVQPSRFFTCEQQARFRKCDSTWMVRGGYCANTCGRCECPPISFIAFESGRCECDDIPPSSTTTCEDQKRWGKCSRNWMRAPRAGVPLGFCATTCGRCTCPDLFPTSPPPPVPVPDGLPDGCICSDIIPDGSLFNCFAQNRFGKCDESWMLENNYCQISCGRCACAPPPADPCETLGQSADGVAVLRVVSVGESAIASNTSESVSSAIAAIQEESETAVTAAQASAEAIALAVARAVASVSISGCTLGEDSTAIGIGQAESDAFASAVGSGIASAFAEAGTESVQLNASTYERVVSEGIAYASAEVQLQGDASIDLVSSSVSTAIACVLVDSLSRAYAQLDNSDSDAIAQVAVSAQECPQDLIDNLVGLTSEEQLFLPSSISPSPSPSTVTPPSPASAEQKSSNGECIDVPSTVIRRSCAFIAARGRCSAILPGECELSCGVC